MKLLFQVTRSPALALGVLLAFPLLAADGGASKLGSPPDPSAGLIALDSANGDVVSSGPFAKVTKNLDVVGAGIRAVFFATTDVWAHDGYAYTGTFNNPCGGDSEAGVWIWDVHNANNPSFVGIIPSPTGSRSNDVKVAAMNSGDILVHSNESCAGGPGGFEIYNVDDPANPVHLASVQTDDVNSFLRDVGFRDFGVHNLFLFTQGENDYVAATVESEFGNFQIFDVTDPTNPSLVGFWGAEQLHRPDVTDWADLTDFGIILDADAYLSSGFGASQNRFLHDITISADGTHAYLANWDAGLVLLDISDVTGPSLVSVAIDPTSEDGEVNSHSVWPSEDGSIVIEGEEDFAPLEVQFAITSGSNVGTYQTVEGSITVPIWTLPGLEMSGSAVYVGYGCEGYHTSGPPYTEPMPPADAADQIALIQRGSCSFSHKINNAEGAGYRGVVVFNDEARGDALVSMGGAPTNLPGVFVGHSTGLAIAGAASAGDLVIGTVGADVRAAAVANGWGGFRIWDYSDPVNPVLASTFNTVCSATVIDDTCDPVGNYSSHNVIVETTGNKVKAYVSWYDQGVLILDITDPSNPIETARYTAPGENFWGIYKQPNSPWIYGSDRNNGLVIFKEKGAGSAKKR